MTDSTPARLRTLIVDDEPLAIERLMTLCSAVDALAVVGTATNGVIAHDLVSTLKPDLILLDISMPEMDGMTLARLLASQKADRSSIVFVTAYDSFAVEAFDLPAVDYVLKPVAPDRLRRAVERVQIARSQPEPPASQAEAPDYAQEFWVPHRSELVRIAACDIDRVDAERDYMRLHVGTGSYLVHQTITALESRLDPAAFIRLHRSVIVRRERIKGFGHDRAGAWHAELVDGAVVRIGRTYLAAAKAMAGR